jgi:anti-sigma regulatory factor (Ser/Thr protein kinase)
MNGTAAPTFDEWVQLTLPPDVTLIASVISRVTADLSTRGVGSTPLNAIRLALTEALTNSIKHGQAAADSSDD